MIEVLEYKPRQKIQIRNNVQNKKHSLQFLPISLFEISRIKFVNHKGHNLKTSYLIDIVHNLLLKYYFKKENRFSLSSLILKEKYGYLYNHYIDWLLNNGTIAMVQNYKAGKRARVYRLNESIIKGTISRYRNIDKVLLKKWKNVVSSIDNSDLVTNQILPEIKKKLVDDLFHVQIDYEKSIFFLDSTMQDFDIYNKNKYSIDAIKDQHIFYHFDSYGRMHTNFTILKSFIRKNCLLIDGEETYELDIKNSQPLFLTKLILEEGLIDVDLFEFELFKQLTTQGKFYQYFMDNSDIKEKSKIKELTYKVLFGKNYRSKAESNFNRLFPTIHNFIKIYKKMSKDYRSLSHQLQRDESKLIFNEVIREIMNIYPEVKLITIHDSIIFQKKYKKQVEEIFDNKIKKEFNI